MTLDPIGTPRRIGSLALTASNSDGWNNRNSSRITSNASTPARRPMRTPTTHSTADLDADSTAHVRGLWDRYTFLKNTENVKDALLEELLTRYSNLVEDYEELKRSKPTNSATPSSAGLQLELQQCREQNGTLFNMLARDPYVMVLIDGDGMIFNNELLRLGEEGGRKAATQVKANISRFLRTEKEGCPSEFKVVARVYANVRGLSETLVRAGILSSSLIFEEFVRGFTRGDALCDFIDVGAGKDRADLKINENFKVHIHDYQCRQVVFGCSHDNGYARLLEEYMDEPQVMSRLTLLEGVPFQKELAALPFGKAKIPGLFREAKISVDMMAELPRLRQDSKNIFNPNSAIFTPPTQTPAPITPLYSPKSGAIGSDATSSMRGDRTRTNSISSSVAVCETPVSNGTSMAGGWAGVARATAHLPFKDITKPVVEKPVAGPVVLQNKAGQRLDKQMDYDHDKVYRLKQIKLCNQHYIGKGCCHYNAANGACPHRHDLKLSKEDLKWLRVVARETVCKKGTQCLELDCIYGHHCPYPKQTEGSMRGIGCINGDNCRFAKEMHGMDTKVHKVLKPEDLFQEEEY